MDIVEVLFKLVFGQKQYRHKTTDDFQEFEREVIRVQREIEGMGNNPCRQDHNEILARYINKTKKSPFFGDTSDLQLAKSFLGEHGYFSIHI